MTRCYCALVHHPVRDRAGNTVTSAVTNLDVHDLARSARTFGLRGYFVVTPIEAQQRVVERILGHWSHGPGKQRIPERGEALSLVRLARSVDEACTMIAELEGAPPRILVTAARLPEGVERSSYEAERERAQREPCLVLFGTGHGLAADVMARANAALPPIRGGTDYNHLSVRAAAGILLDRLFGDR